MPKIRIEADMAGVMAEMDKLAKRAKEISKEFNAPNRGGSQAAFNGLLSQAEQLADKLEGIGKKDITPKSLSAFSKHFSDIAKTAQDFEKKLSGTTTRSSWISTMSDELGKVAKGEKDLTRVHQLMAQARIRVSREEVKTMVKRSGAGIQDRYKGTRFAGSNLAEVLGARNNKLRDEVLQNLGISSGKGPGTRSMVSSFMPGSAGDVLRGATEAAGEAEGGGLSLGGIGRFAEFGGLALGGFVALALAKGVGAKVGEATDESIVISDLRQSLGAVNTDFNVLRDSIHGAVDGFGVLPAESAKLAEEFVRTSGVVRDVSDIAHSAG